MKPSDNKKYKEALKSVIPEFDQVQLWDNIEQKLDEKKRKRRILFFFFGGLSMLAAVLVFWVSISTNGINMSPTISESYMLHDAKEVQEVVPTKQQDVYDENLSNVKTETTEKNSTVATALANNFQDPASKKINKKSLSINSEKRFSDNVIKKKFLSRRHLNQSNTNTVVPITVLSIKGLYKKSVQSNNNHVSNISIGLKYDQSYTIRPSITKGKRFLFATSAGIPSSMYSSQNSQSESWANQISESNTDLYALGLVGSYHVDLSNNLSVSAGVLLSRVSERYNRTFENIETRTIQQDSAIFIVNSFGESQYYSGTRTLTGKTETRVQQYNHFYNLGLSLGAMYRKNINHKLSAYIDGNVIFSPLQISTGLTEGSDDNYINLNAITNRQLLQLSAGSGLSYKYNDRYSYLLGIEWTSDITNRFSSEDISHRKNILGLKLGVMYTIK